MTIDWPLLVNRGTALVWVLLAALGVLRRVRRLHRLSRIVLPEPRAVEDEDYLDSVCRSTYLRLGVKIVLLIGGLIALFQLTDLYLVWRAAIIAALVLMDFETINVDQVRHRLALSAQMRDATATVEDA